MQKFTKKRRQRMIDAMVEDYLSAIRQDYKFAAEIVEFGFKGFENYTNEELDKACQDSEIERYKEN